MSAKTKNVGANLKDLPFAFDMSKPHQNTSLTEFLDPKIQLLYGTLGNFEFKFSMLAQGATYHTQVSRESVIKQPEVAKEAIDSGQNAIKAAVKVVQALPRETQEAFFAHVLEEVDKKEGLAKILNISVPVLKETLSYIKENAQRSAGVVAVILPDGKEAGELKK